MIVGGGYFEGSHDQCLMAGPFIHDSSQIHKVNGHTSIEMQKFEVPSFSTEALSSPTNLCSEDVGGTKLLQHQLGIDLEHEAPTGETASWDPSFCTIQDQIINHQFGGYSANMLVEPEIQQYDAALYPNGAYTPAPDLLNLLRINVASAFPAETSVFGDAVLNGSNYLDLNGELAGVAAIPDNGLMFTGGSAMHLRYHDTQPHLADNICHTLPQNCGLFPSEDEREVMIEAGRVVDLFQEVDDRQFDSTLECRKGKGEFSKGKGKANFATERERREQLNVKYRTLRMLFPNPTKVRPLSFLHNSN
jgi:hypothetical protein